MPTTLTILRLVPISVDVTSAERQVITCYRHPKRETGRYCTRCGQPACPDCLVTAPVGAHCLECVKAAAKLEAQTRRKHGVKRDLPLVATGTLIAAIVSGFAYAQSAPVDVRAGYIGASEALVRWGAIGAQIQDGELYRMITSAFVHVEALHVLFAVASVALLGSQLEREEGPVRLLALFATAAGAGSMAGFVVLEPTTLAWGSAAATSGIAGASLMRAMRWNVLAVRTPAAFLGLTALLSVMAAGPESFASLMAGAAVGLAFGAVTTYKARAVDAWRPMLLLAAVAAGCVYLVSTFQPGV